MKETFGKFTGDLVFFIALMATSIALSGALAHAFEMLNKLALSGEQYFTVQQIYAGWNRFAYVLLVEFLAIAALVYFYWRHASVLSALLAALFFLVITQVVFWVWTFPANTATDQWTTQPDNWAMLRDQWEYSHLAGAIFQFMVMASLVIALIRRSDRQQREHP